MALLHNLDLSACVSHNKLSLKLHPLPPSLYDDGCDGQMFTYFLAVHTFKFHKLKISVIVCLCSWCRYKERLRTKCLKDPVQKLKLSGALNGRGWRFLTAGLDDFRDGYPIPQAGTLTQPQHGTEAVIFGLSHKPEKSSRRRFTKEQVCFSKQNCLRQTRRRLVDAVEQSLSTHPFALYPHLGSGMAPEVDYMKLIKMGHLQKLHQTRQNTSLTLLVIPSAVTWSSEQRWSKKFCFTIVSVICLRYTKAWFSSLFVSDCDVPKMSQSLFLLITTTMW